MGTAASKPAELAQQGDKPAKANVKPPQDWSNEEQNFVMISPMSDLSNPSQFRHRIREGQAPPVPKDLGNVAPRLTQRANGTVPAPASFYFAKQQQDDESTVPPRQSMDKKKKKVAAKQKAVKNKAKGGAKRVFKGCWDVNRQTIQGCVREKPVMHQRLLSMTPRDNHHNNNSKLDPRRMTNEGSLRQDAPQLVLPVGQEISFNPALQPDDEPSESEETLDDTRPYEEVYVDRLLEKNKREPMPPVKAKTTYTMDKSKSSLKSYGDQAGAVRDLPSPSIQEEEKELDDDSKEENNSISRTIEKFERRASSDRNVPRHQSIGSRKADADNVRRNSTTRNQPTTEDSVEDEPNPGKPVNAYLAAIKRSSYPGSIKSEHEPAADTKDGRGSNETFPSTRRSVTRATKEPIAEDEEAPSLLGEGIEEDDDSQTAATRRRESEPTTHSSNNQARRMTVPSALDKKKGTTETATQRQKLMPGSTIQQMLLQTYPIATTCHQQKQDDSTVGTKETKKSYRSLRSVDSPAVTDNTPQTPMSDSSKGMVSTEAIKNATFLFSPSYAEGDQALLKLPASHKGSTPFSISTADSRNRLVARPIPRPDPSQYDATDNPSVLGSSTGENRFSGSDELNQMYGDEERDATEPEEVVVREIGRNLSDLTASTGFSRESAASATTHHTTVTPIPEEEPIAEINPNSAASRHSTNPMDEASVDSPPTEDDEDNEPVRGPTYPTNWSYSIDMDNGVTPLRSGKGPDTTATTNSPFIRFNQAKQKFAGGKDVTESTSRESLDSQKGAGASGLVRSRIVAMEGASKSKEEAQDIDKATVAKVTTTSAESFMKDKRAKSSEMPLEMPVRKSSPRGEDSSMHQPQRKPSPRESELTRSSLEGTGRKSSLGYEGDASRISFGPPHDRNGLNLYQKAIDEDSSFGEDDLNSLPSHLGEQPTATSKVGSNYESELDTTVDDFAALLGDDGETEDEAEDGSVDESSIDELTVSTVRQETAMEEVERMISGHPHFSAAEDNTSVSASSIGTMTVSTIRQERENTSAAASSTLSSVLNEAKPSAPFRESGTVRPNEQLHRAAPGALCLSPMQKTPMQARKWRALAAAAQEKGSQRPLSKTKFGGKPRRSLTERDTNVFL